MNESIEKTGAPAAYRPRFSYYHANSKGTGSALQLELHPAEKHPECPCPDHITADFQRFTVF